MQKKLTITVDQAVYQGPCKVIAPRKISQFIEGLGCPHVIKSDLEAT